MWPFKSTKTLSNEDMLTARLLHLEARMVGVEKSCIMIAEAMKTMADASNHNFGAMQKQFLQLVNYVMTPRVSIMGEQKEKN